MRIVGYILLTVIVALAFFACSVMLAGAMMLFGGGMV